MDDLVTVIIPVYNMRERVTRCVDSITAQTYRNLQIILIDDGSTDGSGEICEELAASDMRIQTVRQTNGGLSAARNTGLDKACGSWVAFVDSDDYISPYFVDDMLTGALQYNCDIAIGNFAEVSEDDADAAPFRRVMSARRITGREACLRHFGKDALLLNTSWGKLFRTSLWEGVRFPHGRINEDVFVSHMLLYGAAGVVLTDAVLYAYVQTRDSIMRSRFTANRLDVLDGWLEGVHFYNSAGEPGLEHIARRVYCCRMFDARCICRKALRGDHSLNKNLRTGSHSAYIDAKPFSGYEDCSMVKAIAFRLKLLLGRFCIPLYSLLFVRGRTYI